MSSIGGGLTVAVAAAAVAAVWKAATRYDRGRDHDNDPKNQR
jgi:hypothetical protein